MMILGPKKEPFKATKIERKEEKDKYLEEFASMLNKITKKTYESHHDKIFNLLDNVLQDDSDSEDTDNNDNEHTISNTLFDIIKRCEWDLIYMEHFTKIWLQN